MASAQATNNPKSKEPYTASETVSKGMFPSLIERAFLPQIVSQVPSYFSLPMRSTSSDPNVKCYPIGMQDGIFGPQACLRGQLGAVLLAEPTTSIKTIIDTGFQFASVISQDIEPYDLTSKYVFCYSPSSCHGGLCIDLVPGNKYNGHVVAKYCKTIKIQDAINSIGGVFTLLPILETVTKSKDLADDLIFTKPASPIPDEALTSPSSNELGDWEVLASTTYTEWKMIQNPIGCFLCLVRYFINGHELNQEQLIKFDCMGIIGFMLTKCNADLVDVDVLMASHFLIECAQNQMPGPNMELLEMIYTDFIFDFKIWSRAPFQVTIGHIQYISTIIKDDRKYFRKKFGIQFFFDIIRQYYTIPDKLTADDGQAVRMSLLEIIKYYIQKDLNIKEVCVIISFIASVTYEQLIIEIFDLLISQMNNKKVNDQIFLLLHEPTTADLCYSLLVDKKYDTRLQSIVLNVSNRNNTIYKGTITFVNYLLRLFCSSLVACYTQNGFQRNTN